MSKEAVKVLKVAVPALFVIALLAVGGFYFSTPAMLSSGAPVSSSPLHVAYVTSSGACHNGDAACLTHVQSKSHNVYTNMGMNATAAYLFCGGIATCTALQPYDVISVGIVNYSQTASDTCLNNATAAGKICTDWTANGLTQAAGTVAFVSSPALTGGNTSITKTFTCTSCSNTVINGTGLYNTTTTCSSSTAGCVMFAEANFTSATLQTNDQINVTWYIWTQ